MKRAFFNLKMFWLAFVLFGWVNYACAQELVSLEDGMFPMAAEGESFGNWTRTDVAIENNLAQGGEFGLISASDTMPDVGETILFEGEFPVKRDENGLTVQYAVEGQVQSKTFPVGEDPVSSFGALADFTRNNIEYPAQHIDEKASAALLNLDEDGMAAAIKDYNMLDQRLLSVKSHNVLNLLGANTEKIYGSCLQESEAYMEQGKIEYARAQYSKIAEVDGILRRLSPDSKTDGAAASDARNKLNSLNKALPAGSYEQGVYQGDNEALKNAVYYQISGDSRQWVQVKTQDGQGDFWKLVDINKADFHEGRDLRGNMELVAGGDISPITDAIVGRKVLISSTGKEAWMDTGAFYEGLFISTPY